MTKLLALGHHLLISDLEVLIAGTNVVRVDLIVQIASFGTCHVCDVSGEVAKDGFKDEYKAFKDGGKQGVEVVNLNLEHKKVNTVIVAKCS